MTIFRALIALLVLGGLGCREAGSPEGAPGPDSVNSILARLPSREAFSKRRDDRLATECAEVRRKLSDYLLRASKSPLSAGEALTSPLLTELLEYLDTLALTARFHVLARNAEERAETLAAISEVLLTIRHLSQESQLIQARIDARR